MIKRIFTFVLIATISFTVTSAIARQGFDKNAFFSAMASSQVSSMDAQLNAVKNISGSDREAFEGAMLMRKAGMLSVPAKKLAMFKQGHKKLEAAIAKNPGNAEYRFLRLIVQENAPRSLGYYKNISQDSRMVKDYYKSLSAATQNNVASYSKKSKALSGAF